MNAILDAATCWGLSQKRLDLIVLKPAMKRKYRNGGFEICWAGIARK